MPAYLHAIGTATPAHSFAQDDLRDAFTDWLGGGRRVRRLLRQVYAASGIDRRHSAVPDLARADGNAIVSRAPDSGDVRIIDTGARMRLYQELAGPLFVAAARRALDRAGTAPERVTHLITASCTGFYCPGPDLDIQRALGLPPDIARQHLGFMGCYAAIPALRLADQIARAEPDATVLVVCAELCSLHLHLAPDLDTLRASALFADGAAGAVISSRPPDRPGTGWRLDAFGSALVPEGRENMAWTIGSHGFQMTLDGQVPRLIQGAARDAIRDVLASRDLGIGDIAAWAVHPGGVGILHAVQTALGLAPDALDTAHDILRHHGNMSSPTVLFVLSALPRRPGPTLALAFGPGLTLEMATLTPLA